MGERAFFDDDGNVPLYAQGNGSVHADYHDQQPQGNYEISEDGSGSVTSADYLDTPNFSQRPQRGRSHRSSAPPHLDPGELRHQPRNYPPSEPSPELHENPQTPFYQGLRCQRCRSSRRELQRRQLQLEECQREKKAAEGEIESLRIRLFHSQKESNNYEDAETLYHKVVTERDPETWEDAAILDLKHSFAEMLIGQERFNEADLISGAVWETRKRCPDPPSEETKKSHRQRCSVLCSQGRFEEAENMHRTMFHKEPKDSWALENGDAVCRTMAMQGLYNQAQLMQDRVWKTRQSQDGPRHELTIRSGLQRIAFLETLISTIDSQTISDAEKRLSNARKQGFDCEMEVMLSSIWNSRLHPEPSTGILDAGHRLGCILFVQAKFADAENVFLDVWEGRKQKLGEGDTNAMSTGSMLGRTLQRQGRPDSYRKAVIIFRKIWLARQSILKKGDNETIASGNDLGQVYFSLEDWPNAELTYRWLLDQRARRLNWTAPETVDARWHLGQVLFKQDKDQEAGRILGDVYQQWNVSCPQSKSTLKCGHMVAELLCGSDGKTSEALDVIQDVFNRKESSLERDVSYLDSGRLYGWLLLEVEDFPGAEKVLGVLWEHQARGLEEDQMRLKCGHLYGQSLFRQQKCSEAKEILEAVTAAQGAIFPAESLELTETRQLLTEVEDRLNLMAKPRAPKVRGVRNRRLFR